jgi:hypothetical protein
VEEEKPMHQETLLDIEQYERWGLSFPIYLQTTVEKHLPPSYVRACMCTWSILAETVIVLVCFQKVLGSNARKPAVLTE